MDGRPHDRPLHDAAPLQRPGERGPFEALEPRPEPDVHRRRVLRLDPADALERLRNRQPCTLEEQLAGKEGAVELSLGENPLGHRVGEERHHRLADGVEAAGRDGGEVVAEPVPAREVEVDQVDRRHPCSDERDVVVEDVSLFPDGKVPPVSGAGGRGAELPPQRPVRVALPRDRELLVADEVEDDRGFGGAESPCRHLAAAQAVALELGVRERPSAPPRRRRRRSRASAGSGVAESSGRAGARPPSRRPRRWRRRTRGCPSCRSGRRGRPCGEGFARESCPRRFAALPERPGSGRRESSVAESPRARATSASRRAADRARPVARGRSRRPCRRSGPRVRSAQPPRRRRASERRAS